MNPLKLLLAEIGYRKLNFVLSLFAVTVAVMLFVAGPIVIDGFARQTEDELARLEDQTRKLMRDMGFNLLIVHRDTNMSDFWAEDFATVDMPQDYIDRLAADDRLTLVTHLVASLQQKITWQDRKVLLIGYLPETPQPHRAKTKFAKRRQKKPMGYDVAAGTVHLGYELGIGRQQGQTVEVLGKPFRIAKIAAEQGSKEDITIKMALEDAQTLLDKSGRINQILALGCRCSGSRLAKIRKELVDVLPETRITEFRSMAVARAEQRDLVGESRAKQQKRVELLATIVTPLVMLACGVWIGLLALSNVHQRRSEIGILRALGKSSTMIAGLFLGRAVVVGLFGAGVGFALGSALAETLGRMVLEVPADAFSTRWDILAAALIGAPLLSAVASFLPTLTALQQDPAVVLRDH